MLDLVRNFPTKLKEITYEQEFNTIVNLIKEEYKSSIDKSLHIIGETLVKINKDLEEEIPVRYPSATKVNVFIDSDFDGYASAKCVYTFLHLLGVPKDRFRLIPLSSLHKSEEINISNSLTVVTDCSLGNIRYKGTSFKLLCMDHHQILFVDYLKWKRLLYDLGEFVNSNLSTRHLIKGLSCGALVFLYINAAIDLMGLSPSNRFHLKTEFNRVCRMEALMSLISDEMEFGNYLGLIKGIYEAPKNRFYTSLKNKFTYDNHSYYRKYIARVNNLIRMEREEVVKDLIKDNVDYSTLSVIQRVDTDRNLIIKQFLEPCEPLYDYSTPTLAVEVYEVPLSENPVMRNFKGFLASIKIPQQKDFVIFSGYKSNGSIYLSCRNNVSIDVKSLVRENVPTVNIGGHKQAFGFELKEAHFPTFLAVVEYIADSDFEELGATIEDDVLSYPDLERGFQDLSDIALYNEFTRTPIKVAFTRNHFDRVQIEKKRTVYYLPIANKPPIQVVSFDLEEKDSLICIPKLKRSLKELDSLDILEIR